MTDGDRQLAGRSTLPQPATAPMHTSALASDLGCAGRLRAAGASEWVTQAGRLRVPLQALCNPTRELSKLLDFAKEFAKLREAFEITALEKITPKRPWFLLADKKSQVEYHHSQPHTSNVEEAGCFLHPPALLGKFTAVQEIMCFRPGWGWWTERGRMEEFQVLVWTCSPAMPSKEISVGLSNKQI